MFIVYLQCSLRAGSCSGVECILVSVNIFSYIAIINYDIATPQLENCFLFVTFLALNNWPNYWAVVGERLVYLILKINHESTLCIPSSTYVMSG